MTKKTKGIIQYNSPVILTFTFVSFFVLLLGVATDDASTSGLFCNYYTSFADPLMYIRLFTHVIGHAGFDHFFGNFLIILLIGPMIEEKYGSKLLLQLMLFTAFITGLINILFFDSALLGASGIVFMMILLSSYANFEKGRIPLTLILVLVAFIGQELIDGLLEQDDVSQLTHIVGGAIGGVLGYFITESKKIREVKKVE